MAKNDNLKDFVTDIADAIREKKGTTDLINPQDFSDEIRNIETGGDIIDVDTLPTEDIDNDKIYKSTTPKGMFAYIDTDYGEFIDLQIPNYIYVSSINDVTKPMLSDVGTQNSYIYVDTSSFIGYIFISEIERKTLSQFYNEFAGMNFVDRGKIDTIEDAVESGVYFIPQGEEIIIGVPDINFDKGLYKYNGFNWEYLGLNKYDVAGKWQEISSGNIYEFKIDGGILVNDEYNYLADNYKIIDNKVYIFDMDGNQSEPLLYIKSENSTNLARLDNKNFIYNKIEDFKVDEKTLDYDQASGIWYASSLDGNGRVESIMYYVLPLLQDENGKRNVKVYSADAEGFYDSTTPGMTYRIDGNQIKLEMESEGEVSDAGTFGYEVIDNKVHLTSEGEIVFTKIVTGLGANDNGQFVSNYIPQNGLYNGVTLNDPEALYFSAVIDVSGSSGGEETIGDYHIRVIDSYNNNVIDEKWLNTGDIYTLPSPTTHDDVIFDSWECAVPINDGTIVVTNHDIIISNTYLTKSNKSEFKIKITKEIIQNIENGGYLFTLNLDGVKDWGDGTINSETSHTYTQYGEYVISCDGQTMTTTNASGIFGQSSSSKNYTCIDVKITNITRITDYAFQYCCVLQRVLLPQGIQYINDYAFAYCYRLKNIVVPKSALTLSASALYNCSSLEWCVLAYGLTTISGAFNGCTFLEYIEFPDTCKTLYSSTFSNCYRLIKIKLPNQISNVGTNCFSACSALNGVLEFKHDTKISEISSYAFSGCKNIEKIIFNTPKIEYIRAYAFRYCYNLKEIEFSNIESVPALASTNAFTGTEQKDYKIIVPDALYDTWKSSTNWSSLANNIYKKSEV